VISKVNSEACLDQKILVNAAKRANVKRFIPSELAFLALWVHPMTHIMKSLHWHTWPCLVGRILRRTDGGINWNSHWTRKYILINRDWKIAYSYKTSWTMLQQFMNFAPGNSTLIVIPLDSIKATNTWVREHVECGGGKIKVGTWTVGTSVHDSYVDRPALVWYIFSLAIITIFHRRVYSQFTLICLKQIGFLKDSIRCKGLVFNNLTYWLASGPAPLVKRQQWTHVRSMTVKYVTYG